MRAIGYVAYDPDAPSESPASRSSLEREVERFCQLQGHTLTALFADPDGSGVEGRAILHSMFQHLREQPEEFLVVVTDPVHLGSTPEGAVDTVLMVDSLGSRVVCTVEGLPDPIQGLLRTLSTTGPGWERRVRIREAMESKALRGEGLGRPPYGYGIGKAGRLEQVPREADLVRLMFHLYLEEGRGVRSMAGYLNQQGYRTRRGRNWSMVTLRDILRNRVYIGTYHRFGLRMPGNHSPLVPPGDFRRVQDLMQSRSPMRRAADVQPFLLSGLAYCVQCGNRMIGVTRRQTWRRKDGHRMRGVYRYYQCQSRTNQSLCQYHTWRAAVLEETVEEQLRRQIKGALHLPAARRAPAQRPATAASEGWESRRRRRYMKYLKQAADGAITLGRLRYLLGKLAAGSPEVLGPAFHNVDDPLGVEAILDKTGWEKLDDRSRHELLRRWIERVEVGDREVVVRLRRGMAA